MKYNIDQMLKMVHEYLDDKAPMAQQTKNASYKVGKGELTIEDAIANYGIL